LLTLFDDATVAEVERFMRGLQQTFAQIHKPKLLLK
jgi:hypothetical protein